MTCARRAGGKGIIELLGEIVAKPLPVKAGRADAAEVSLTLRCGEDRIGSRSRGLIVSRALVIHEEEELVLDEGTAQGAAELIPSQNWLQTGAVRVIHARHVGLSFGQAVLPAIGIERIIADEFKGVAVEAVCA